ncbi:MAG: hypothetical protein ACRC7G_15415, partial [Beijerinckiaceae bacterium]
MLSDQKRDYPPRSLRGCLLPCVDVKFRAWLVRREPKMAQSRTRIDREVQNFGEYRLLTFSAAAALSKLYRG